MTGAPPAGPTGWFGSGPPAAVATSSGGSLADLLERVLDKGVVIVGDISVSVLDVELLTLRLRLFVASAQTAAELGLDWWLKDPYYSGPGRRRVTDSPAAEGQVPDAAATDGPVPLAAAADGRVP